jgi:nucleotide-binding universal stress UspA family protein
MDMASLDGRIVVGLDGSAGARAALRWALRQAALTAAVVHVVHAVRRLDAYEWVARPTNYGTVPAPVRYDEAEVRTTAEGLAGDAVREAVGDDDRLRAVEVRIDVVEGHPSDALLAAAEQAELLVLGRTGHGGFAGMLLGSVARHCVEHSPCGVVVVPPDQ